MNNINALTTRPGSLKYLDKVEQQLQRKWTALEKQFHESAGKLLLLRRRRFAFSLDSALSAGSKWNANERF